MKTFEHKIRQALHRFIHSYFTIFGREPRFDLSVFALEKGGSIYGQKLSSDRYKLADFVGPVFQDRFREELFGSGHDIVEEIRNYDNYFPDFYHNFLRRRCQEKDSADLFFDLPRYSCEGHLYFLVFSVNGDWLAVNGHDTQAGDEPGGKQAFFQLLVDILRDFLTNEAKIVNGNMVFDEFQVRRLHGLAVSLYMESISANANFFQSINMISSLKYEKQECSARIVLYCNASDMPLKVRFREPVPLSKYRKVRKLLAAIGERHCLVCTGEYFEGIADYYELNAAAGTSIFSINLIKHLTWELTRGEQLLLRYKEGVLYPSRHELHNSTIIAHSMHTLRANHEQAKRILELVRAARAASHGSILVFFSEAAEEAVRLSGDCFPVEPFELGVGDLLSFIVMDGALLLDVDAHCHALGVILDGRAVPDADASRGARFNSALRYYAKNKNKNMLIVVVSDDGMIDIIPEPV